MSQEADEPLKAEIKLLLEQFGFTVTTIVPPPLGSSPDFVAEKNGEQFIFELKERMDDPAVLAEEKVRLEAGELVSFTESIGSNERVSGRAREGVKQLRAHNLTGTGFRLLWLHAGGRDPEVQFEQFRATLYGMTQIVAPELSHTTTCYYFGHSEFFRSREILAGAIISKPKQFQLCINTLFFDVCAFQKSALVKIFSNGLLDPDLLASQGDAFVADCSIDRNDEAGVLQYLQSKYGYARLMNMNLSRASARKLMLPEGSKSLIK